MRWLRDRLVVVSQQPTLFDTSVGENIQYGSMAKAEDESEATSTSTNVITDMNIRTAAKRADVHQVVIIYGPWRGLRYGVWNERKRVERWTSTESPDCTSVSSDGSSLPIFFPGSLADPGRNSGRWLLRGDRWIW